MHPCAVGNYERAGAARLLTAIGTVPKSPPARCVFDLWCITENVHPALIGNLKGFSAHCERNPNIEKLKALKLSLDAWLGGRSAVMLRRMKEDRLPELVPAKEEVSRIENAATPACDLPRCSVVRVRRDKAWRRVGSPAKATRAVAASLARRPYAGRRLRRCLREARRRIAVLDRIAAAAERAFVFLDDLSLQARLAGILQRRYGLE